MSGSRVLRVTILGDASGAEKAMKATADGAAKLDVAIGGIGDGFKKASAGAGALGAALTGAGIGVALKAIEGASKAFDFLKGSVIDTNAALESSRQGWTILLGGAEAAEKQIQSLYTFAAQTPFEFGEVDKAARLLETFGGAALNTTENLTLVGDIAAGVDQPFSDVAMWVGRMYDAMQSGKPFGEAAARLQEMGALSGEARTALEELQKEGATGPELWAKFNATMGRFSGTMKAQSGTWQGLMSTVQDTLNQLAATAGKPIFDFAQKGLQRFATALSDPRVAQFAQLLADRLAGALRIVGDLIQRAWPPLQQFVSGIFSAGKAVFEAAQAFLTGQTNLGQFIGGIENMVGATIGNLAGLKDKIGPPLQAFGAALIGFLGDMLPQIGGQLQVWGERLGTWIQEFALPALAENLPLWIDAYTHWALGTAWPKITEVMGTIGKALGDWVKDVAVPWLLTELPKWETALTGYFYAVVLPAVLRAMGAVAKAMASWIETDAIPQLKANLPIWLGALKDWIVNVGVPFTIEAAKELGGAIVAGIMAGLRAEWGKIEQLLRQLASTLPDPVKNVLGISSPSRVFAGEVGGPIVEGIIAGLLSRQPALDRAIGGLVTVPGSGGIMSPNHNRGGDPANWRSFGASALRDTGDTALAVHLHITAPHLTDLGDATQQRAFAQKAGEAARRAWADLVRGGAGGLR